MYFAVQAMHPKLSAYWILAVYTSKLNPESLFRDMMKVVMKSGHPGVPLHLKVLAYHGDRVRAGDALPLELLDLKTVLLPRLPREAGP